MASKPEDRLVKNLCCRRLHMVSGHCKPVQKLTSMPEKMTVRSLYYKWLQVVANSHRPLWACTSITNPELPKVVEKIEEEDTRSYNCGYCKPLHDGGCNQILHPIITDWTKRGGYTSI